jgi:hypothetical protein
MKIGRRSKHISAKSFFSGPFLRRLNRREKLELAEKSAAAKPVVKARRPAFGLETVEPRLLMSADLSYTTLNDTLTLSIGGTSAAPIVKLSDGSGQLAQVALTNATGAEVDISRSGTGGGAVSADTLHVDLTNFALLNSFVSGNGGQLTVKFDGGDEFQGTPHPFTDVLNVDGNGGTLSYGLTIQSTSDIDSSASVTATSLTLTSAQTASDLLSTGLFANANTGIDLTGANLTTTAGALTLNATSTLSVSTDGTGMSAVKGAVITSFSSADIDIGGNSALHAAGGDLDITASVNGSLTATATGANVKLIAIVGSAAPEVTIGGGSSLTSTTGAVNAAATTSVTISATATPDASANSASVDAAVLSTTYADGATMTVNGGANISAHTNDTMSASSTLNSSTVANAHVANTAGAAVAVSVITGDTTASVTGATVSGSSVSLTAASNRTITTTALSSPGGSASSGNNANASEQTLANNNASTGSSGSVTLAGAIAVSTDTGLTSAFLGNGATVSAVGGVATVSASSVDVVAVTGDGEFTQAGTTGVGVGVAIGVADRTDTAYITGTVNVSAGSLDVAVLEPSASSFTDTATSGVGDSTKVGVAGSLGINVTILDHEAYLDTNAVLNLAGGTNATFESHDVITNTDKALPSDDDGTSTGVGIGASFAINYGQDENEAYIGNGATLSNANNLTLTAIGVHTMQTDATNGGQGATAITPIVATSVADDDSSTTLGTGTLLTIGGALLATSSLTNTVSTNAVGDTKSSKTGVGISLALNIVNDHSTSTTARDITTGGAMSFLSTTVSGSEAFASASVVGGQPDDGNNDQSTDSQTASQKGTADSAASAQDSKATGKASKAKGTEGAKTPSQSTSDGQISVAGGVAVNVNQSSSEAYIADGRTITAGGVLTVKSAANIDGSGSATGAAVANAITIDPTKVSTSASTITLGASSTLKTGDGVTYYSGINGGGIGGLTSGTKYFANVASGGVITLYDTAAHANAGGTTGKITLTSTGSTGQFFDGGGKTGTSVGAAVGVNYVTNTNLAYLGGSTFHVGGLDVEATQANQTFTFNPASAVNTTTNTINLGVTSLATGDGITYTTTGTAIGGLTAGTEYYVNVQADGSVKLYDSQENAVAAGTDGLITLTGAGTGTGTMTNASDDYGASAISGAGGGKTGVAGSAAIDITETDTEADLGYTQPSASPGVPVITITGAGNVTLKATATTVVGASATPVDGGASGDNLGVGISAALNYAQSSTLAQITNGVALTGANNLTLTATASQDMSTTTKGGASGSTAVTPVIDIAITDNDADATLGTGAAISLTGAFSATASLNDQVESSATGSTKSSGTGVGITVTVTVVNDNALATTGRNLTTTDATAANGTVTFSATDLSSSQSNATASVAGGDDDNGSGQHSDNGTDQSVDNTTKKQSSFGDSEVKGTDSKAKGTEGANTNDKAKSSDGSVSVAGAVAIDIENGTAEAFIPDGLTVIATGMLSVTTAAQVNGQAIANGSAAATDGGTGVGVAVAVNVANETNSAYIGNNTVINSGGLTVTAGIAPRSVKLATKALPVVNVGTGETANTIFLGLGTGLSQGDSVVYHANGGTVIGGLTDGTTYFVAGQGDGTFKLYDTAAHAKAGGDTGLMKLTSVGSGTQQFTQQLFGVIPTGTISFAAGGTVTVLDLGDESDLHTGDVVTYNNGGGSNMGGLTNGTQYYIIDLTDNKALLATTLDNAQAGTAITFGAAGSSANQALVDSADNNRAEATSGASGGKIGVSVSVGVNVVKDITTASVGDTAALAAPKVTISHPGAITVTAASAATNIARALPSSGGTGGSSVGVGASVGVNTVTDTTTATIIDGTTWAGTAGAVTVSATAIDTAVTHGENGASGGGVSVGVGAGVAVINDTTTAYVGTGSAIAATGNVAITASETGTFEDTTNASAAGSSVAVGASVSVSVVNETVSAQAARSISTTAGTLGITSTATIVNETEATASAKGEDSNDSQSNSGGKSGADGQADKQLNGNSNTSGSGASLPSASGETSSASSTSSSQGGGDSGNVGVAASVAVGVLSVNNTATVTNSAALTATGAITVQAQAGLTDTTQAVGSAISLQSGSTDVGAGVAVGIVNTTNKATVGTGSVVTGNGITIAAITPAGVVDTFIVWGAAAAGGTGDAAIAGSVAINVINTDDTEAWAASGSTLHSTGALTVKAINNVNIQTLAAAGAVSDGTSIGAAVDVAILNVTSNAFIAGNANATGALTIDAEIVLKPTKLAIPKAPSSLQPTATSVAVAGAAGTGSAAIAGSVIVDVFTMNAAAYIGPNSVVSAGSASITATNTSTITGIAGALGATTGAVGIGASLDLEVINKQTFAYLGAGAKLTISGVGAATIAATSAETMLSVAATAGIGDDAGIAATASIAVINTDTEAYLGNNASLLAGGTVGVTASSTFFTTMIAGSVGVGSTAGIGAANATLVHSATTKADTGTKATVTAAGTGLTISATEKEDILSIVAGVAVGGTAGVAGSATVNVLTEVTTADVGAGSTITVNGAGNLIVSASDSTSVISVAGDLAAGGDAGIGVGVDVGTFSKKTNAFIDSGVTATVGGNIEVLAQASENLISVAAGIAVGTVAVGVNAGVHVFTLQTRAFIGNDPNAPTNQGAGNVHAAGSVVIAANDVSDINEIVGVLAAGAVGVAAGAGVNVFTKDTESFIGVGANVTGLGGGAGLTVDTGRIDTGISASTSTFSPNSPSGQGIQSGSASTLTNAANGNHAAFASAGQVGTPSLGGMDLTGNGNNQSINNSSLSGLRTTSVDTQAGFHGVAVAATNQDEIRTFTVTFGAGEVGIAVSAGVDVVKANTQAYVGNNALVNTGSGAPSAAQSVLVGAGDDFYHLSVGVGVGVGAVGVAPTVGVNVITNTTGAAINTGAKVNAAGSIAVEATGSENIVMVGIGAAAGAVGVGAVVDVLSISNTTLASIGNSAIVHAGDNVFVSAEDDTNVLELSGALAGGFVGVGGSVGVMLITKTTDATIGTSANVEGLGNGGAVGGVLNGSNTGSSFGTTNANGVIVQAQSSESVVHIVAAGGVGYVGVSGAVGLSFLNITTDATIGANASINTANPGSANGNQSVYVNAADNVGFQAYVIGVAGGFVGVTGAVDVGTLSDNIAAVVAAGAVVNAKNNVEVNADGIQNLTGYVISGAGGAVAAGASVMDWSIGQTLQTNYSDNSGHSSSGLTNGKGDPDSNAASQSQSGTGLVTGSHGIGSLNSSGAQANSNAGRINSATGQAGGMANAAAPNSASILAMQGSAPVNPGTTADIQAGAKITAGQNIGVTANDSATVKEFLGQVAGGVVGVGAAVDILSLAANVTANDDGTNTAGNMVNVHAVLNSNVNIVALDLAAGFVGVGAGVVVVTDNSATQSTLGNVTKAKAVTLESDSTRTLTTLTGQASIGAVGAGATFTEITVGGATLATVDAGATIGNVATPVGSLTVTVHSTVTVTESTDAVAAGIGAASANFSFLTVDPTVSATIGGSAVIDAVNAVTLDATSTVDAQGKTFGVAAGGLAVGVSLTEVTVSPAVTADVGTSDSVTAGSLSITAATYLPASGYDAQANASGSAGALIGVTSTNTQTSNNDSVNAFIGNAAKVAVVGAVLVTALNNTGQKSSADSNAGGLIAAGLASSSANSNTTTKAYLGTSVVMTAGDLTIAATGVDNNFASTNAGSGGLIAGSSSVANTTSNSTTLAQVGASDNIHLSDTVVGPVNGLIVAADHTAQFNDQITTFAGGLFAGAGGSVSNNVTSNDQAVVGANAMIAAYNIDVTALNIASKPSLGAGTPNVYGTTGGLVSGAGASVSTTINFTTVVTIGSGAFMNALGVQSNVPTFQLEAGNVFNVNDDLTFETGGAFSGAGANASISVPTDIARVEVQTGAILQSQGALVINARGHGSFDEEVQTDTFGLGTVSVGTASAGTKNAPINVVNQVLIDASSILTAFGDLDIAAGTDGYPDYDQYAVTARYDSYAGALVPISDVNSNAYLNQTNTITISAASVLKTAQQVNLTAQDLATGNMISFATAVSWASDVADAILTALGGGGVEVHGGNANNQIYSTITNNGTIQTGINSHLTLTLINNPNFNPSDPTSQAVIATAGSSPTITFEVGTAIPTNPLVAELAYDQEQLALFGSDNTALQQYYTAEIQRIQAVLTSEGLLTDEGNGQTSANPQPELEVTINPIYAEAGEVDVHATEFGGTGTIIAPNSASVTIINNSAASLNLLGIDIPDTNGGLWYDIGLVTTNAQINTINNNNRNSDGNSPPDTVATPAFNLTNVAGGPAAVVPAIIVENKFNINQYNAQHPDAPLPWPSITVLPTSAGGIGITNPAGSLLLENDPPSTGNITIEGPVNVGTQDIITGGTLVITGVSDEEVGGDPYKAWDAITVGAYVGGEPGATTGGVGPASASAINTLLTTVPTHGLTGASITVNADYIDVNGLINAGVSTYNLTINSSVSAEIQSLLNQGYTGLLNLAAESTANFVVDYNTQTHQIVVTSLPVNGGFVSLTGHIVDTGNGTINVFGGYGTINVTNNSNFDLGLQTLDTSQPGQGTLVINDLAKNSQSASTFSTYQFVPGTGIQIASNPGGSASTTHTTVGGSSTVYAPAAGWRYGWTIQDSEQTILQQRSVSSNWIGLIPTGSSFAASASVVANGTPTISPSGPYFYFDNSLTPGSAAYNLQQKVVPITTSTGAIITKFHTEISHWYGGHTYSALFQQINGTENLYENDISASRNIAVNFTGGATGGLTVNNNGLGNVHILGNVLDPHGATTINAVHGTIVDDTTSALVTGQSLTLKAAGPIGSVTAPIQVVVTGTAVGLNASTINGDVNITAVTGNLTIQSVVSGSQGAVNLTSTGGIPTATSGPGLVQGGIITLVAKGGGIGTSTALPILLSTPNPVPGLVDTITATAQTNVYLQEKTGNMLVNTITTGGDVWVNAPNGSILNANSNSTIDTRTQAQLAAGVWTELGLTSSTGYQSKVNNTLASFVGEQNAQYEAYWQDLMAGNTSASGFSALAAIFGPGGSYAQQDPSYNPNVYYGASAVISAPAYFTGNTSSAPAYFTAAGTVQNASVYFTAGSGAANGTITRTDGGNWLTQGFKVGQAITVGGSNHNSTGTASFTITAVAANVITLSPADVIQTEASASNGEAVTVQANASINRTAGNWLADGFAVGQTISVGGSAANSTAAGVTYTITAVSAGAIALSPTNVIATEASAGTPETITVTNNKSGTITRTDGSSWIASGFAVGQTITVGGSAGNATSAGETYSIAAVTASTITLAASNQIVNEASPVSPETVSLQHNTSDGQIAVKGFFTAKSGSTPGSITRTDGGNWLTDGFAVGQTVLVNGSAGNSTVGATSYTVTAVSATVLTLSNGDTIVGEATAAAPEAFTVQHKFSYKMTASQISTLSGGIKDWTPAQLMSLFGAGLLKDVTDTVVVVGAPDIIGANVTMLAGAAVGTQTGGTITIPLSYPPNAPTVLTTADQIALAGAERVDVQYLAGPAFNATVNFGTNTITRTDGGNWSALAAGESLSIQAVSGQFTQNATDGTLYYKIAAINGNTLTIDPTTPLVAVETGKTVSIAPVILDPSFQESAAAQSAGVYFTANTATSGGTITRISGSWLTDGYAVGQLIEIGGSLKNATSPDVPDVIVAVTATTITLATNTLVFAEASAATPETISITRGIAPKPTAIQIQQITPMNVNATGLITITAKNNVYLDSAIDVRLNQVAAGTLAIGSQIQIKGQQSILSGVPSSPTANLQGGNIILEAAGLNGSAGTIGTSSTPVTIASVATGTVTARAKGDVNLDDVASTGNAGNLQLETVFSQTGNALLIATGSITAALDNGFTTVQANNVLMEALNGTIGNIVNGSINYIYLDNPGTVEAIAHGNIWISEGDLFLSFNLSLKAELIGSITGDVTLRAGLSILDGSNSPTGTEVIGNNITLMALSGGIGLANDPLGIRSAYSAAGDLTASANLANIYIVQTVGTVSLNTVTDPNRSVFITALQGSILNGAAAGVTNITAANADLIAQDDIGVSGDRITTQVAVLETDSITGDSEVDNTGALSIGGSFTTNAAGAQAGGDMFITASSPVTIVKSVYAAGDIDIIAQNGPVGSTTDGPGNLVVDALDLKNVPLVVAGNSIALLAGDNLTIQKGASVKAGFSIYLKSDYQGGLNGFPPRLPPPSEFVTVGTTLLIAGIVIAPNIKIEGGDGPDTILANPTSILNAAYPWTAKTYPPQLGAFPRAPDTADSLITILGDAGNDTITVVGVATALEIDVFGNNGTDIIQLTPTNVLIGSDVIFGDNGIVERTSSGVFNEIFSTVSGGGNNDKITVGPATNVIAFGGEGADTINLANTTNSIVFGDEGQLDYNSGLSGTSALTNGIHSDSVILIPPGTLVSAETIDTGVGGNDTITIGTGTKLVFGGPGADSIVAGAGNATVFGDDGQVIYSVFTGAMISAISSNPTDGTGDTITVGAGNNFIIGGIGNNIITGLLGNNVIIGDNGEIDFSNGLLETVKSTFPSAGGSNRITVGNGTDVIIGGNGANTIVAGNGSNLIIANTGEVDYSPDTGLITDAFNTDVFFNDQNSTTVLPPTLWGGNNIITVGSGTDMILGGVHVDTITSGNGNSVIFGDNGYLAFNGAGLLEAAESINNAFGGNDVIRLGIGNNIAVGGMANDGISATTGNQIILGDNAYIAWGFQLRNVGALVVPTVPINVFAVAGPLRVVETVDAIDGGNDSITGGNGNDLIAGGILNDVISVGTGNSVILGDDGEFDFVATGLISAETEDPGFGGNDTITLGSGKNIVYGGSGADTITATTGNQIIVGDNGTVTWATPGVLQSVVADDIFNSAGGNQSQGTGPLPYGSNDIITGGAGNDLIAGGVGNDTITTSGNGNSVIMGDDGEFDFNATGLLISATTQQLAYGGADAITLGAGNNIALGGSGADRISAVSGNQIIVGDNGTVTYFTPGVLQTVVTTDVVFQQIGTVGDGIAIFGFVTYGGNDTITGGSGNDQIAGGIGSDLITTGNGSNDVLGDEGEYIYSTPGKVAAMLTESPTFGSADTIALGTGSNIAFGGAGADRITAGLGNQIILGDNGLAVFNGTTGLVLLVETTDPTTGDNDVINIGGNGLIMGGVGNDTITTTGTGNSVILGDDGVFTFNAAGQLMSATTTDPTVGGTDTIALGTGNNIAFGGTGADTITATTGNQIVVGDDGSVTYSAPGVLQSVQAQDVAIVVDGAPVTYGGNDRIALGAGNDSVMGGLGADVITATDGNDLVLGDDGILTWVNGVITSAATQNPAFGGNDTIILGNGLNVIIGGLGNNIITGGSSTVATGGNTVIGANGDVAFLPSGVVGYVENSDPAYFGNETITTGLGNDRILGGLGTNVIRDAGGSNVIFGADGALTFVDDTIEGDATLLAFSGQTKAGTGGWTIYSAGLLVSAISTDLTSGGNDTILAGGGQNLIVGGFGSSKITAGDGQNIIIGGNGQANAAGAGFLDQVETLAPAATTASNTITAGNGSNIIIGGLGADKITAGNGPDIVFGDAGEVTFSTFTRTKVTGQPFDTVADPVYAEAQSIASSLGGADTITLGKGNIAVFGGNGNDTIKTATVTTTGGSAYVVFGGDGQALFNPGGWVKSAVIPFPQYTGSDTITLGTNPPVVLTGAADVLMSTLATPAPQMASGPAPTGQNTKPGLVASQIQPVVVEAEAIWAKVLGPNNARLAILNGITVQVGELPNAQIGDTIGDTIYIDSTADGWGWYIDPSASGNAGFQSTAIPGVMTAVPGSAAVGHMDLLSTVLHEMGNVMGFPEDSGPDVTGSVLAPGTRRLPALEGAVGVASGVPMIDWTALNNVAATGSSIQPSGDGPSWIDNFVTNMGQAGGSQRPNAGIRIKPPGG